MDDSEARGPRAFVDSIGFGVRRLRQRWRRLTFKRIARAMPLAGYPARNSIPFVDMLSDEQLSELNAIVDWHAFVVDGHGRRFGNAAWRGKREAPAGVDHARTRMMHDLFGLTDRAVLEVGCFEGIHTLGLCALGARVTAIDSRVGNVVKTIVRTALFDHHPRVFVCDVEKRPPPAALLSAELCHHVGVLYHLKDPVTHVRDLGRWISRGIVLDTHYVEEADADETYVVDGERYPYRRYGEYGPREALSGMYDHSKWLSLPTILALLKRSGFEKLLKVEPRAGTPAPRVLIVASKT